MASTMAPVFLRPVSPVSPAKSPESSQSCGVSGYCFLNSLAYPARRARPPVGLWGQPHGSVHPNTSLEYRMTRSAGGPPWTTVDGMMPEAGAGTADCTGAWELSAGEPARDARGVPGNPGPETSHTRATRIDALRRTARRAFRENDLNTLPSGDGKSL